MSGPVAQAIVGGAFGPSGQNLLPTACTPVDRLVDEVIVGTEKLVVRDPAIDIEPMADETVADRVEAWLAEAVAAGATVGTGVRREGTYPWPTVFVHVPAAGQVLTEEVFGPVVSIQTYDDLDASVAEINGSDYGLQAGCSPQTSTLHSKSPRDCGPGR